MLFRSQALAIFPLLLQLPIWLWAVWLIAIVWRVQIYRGQLSFPSALVKAIAAGVVVTGLLLSFSLQINIHALIGMFFCAYVLKLIEFRTKRDGLLLVFLGFFGGRLTVLVCSKHDRCILWVHIMSSACYGMESLIPR